MLTPHPLDTPDPRLVPDYLQHLVGAMNLGAPAATAIPLWQLGFINRGHLGGGLYATRSPFTGQIYFGVGMGRDTTFDQHLTDNGMPHVGALKPAAPGDEQVVAFTRDLDNTWYAHPINNRYGQIKNGVLDDNLREWIIDSDDAAYASFLGLAALRRRYGRRSSLTPEVAAVSKVFTLRERERIVRGMIPFSMQHLVEQYAKSAARSTT